MARRWHSIKTRRATKLFALLVPLAPIPISAQDPAPNLKDKRLTPITITTESGFLQPLKRAEELDASGDPLGAVKILDKLCREKWPALMAVDKNRHLPAHRILANWFRRHSPATREAWHLRNAAAAEQTVKEARENRDGQALQVLLRRYPGVPATFQALLILGDLAFDRGNPWQALYWYRQAEKENPSPGPLKLRLKYTLDILADAEGPKGKTPGEETSSFTRLWDRPTEKLISPITKTQRNSRRFFIFRGSRSKLRLAGPGDIYTLDCKGPRLLLAPDHLLIRHRLGFDLLDFATGRLRNLLRTQPGKTFDPAQDYPSDEACGRGERAICRQGSTIFFLSDIHQDVTQNGSRVIATSPVNMFSICAYDLDTNAVAWKTRIQSLLAGKEKGFLHAGPIYTNGKVAVLIQQDNSYTMLGLCAKTGQLLWSQPLHNGGSAFFRSAAIPLVAKNGFFYVATGAGTITALNAESGEILWLQAYPRIDKNVLSSPIPRSRYNRTVSYAGRGFIVSDLYLCGEILILAPPDGDYLVAISVHDGEILWLSSRFDPRERVTNRPSVEVVVGHDSKNLYLVGRRLMAVEIATGRRLWEKKVPQIKGRGSVTANAIFLPTKDGVLRLSKDGKADNELLTLPGYRSGPCHIFRQGHFLLAAGLDLVSLWVDRAPWIKAAQDYQQRARRMAICGMLQAAITTLMPAPPEQRDHLITTWALDRAEKQAREEKIELAIAELEKIIEIIIAPGDRARLLYGLADLLRQSDRHQEVRTIIQKARRLSRTHREKRPQ